MAVIPVTRGGSRTTPVPHGGTSRVAVKPERINTTDAPTCTMNTDTRPPVPTEPHIHIKGEIFLARFGLCGLLLVCNDFVTWVVLMLLFCDFWCCIGWRGYRYYGT